MENENETESGNQDMPEGTNKDPEIFSRGSLKLTFDLVRKSNPQLAMDIRNITCGEPEPKDPGQPDNKNTDCFRVPFDSFQVRFVVEALMEHCQQVNTNTPEGELGTAIVARALTDDWMALASKMIASLQAEQQKPGP
jgi:hypothetical protein